MIFPLLRATRPQQWLKNLFVLPALIFSKHVFEWDYLLQSLGGMLCFWVLSCAVYLFNDLVDVEQDRLHPEKSKRPIAAGELGKTQALIASACLAIIGIVGAFWLRFEFGYVVLAYALFNLAYSLRLKRVVLVDVMLVAAGFFLRALGGAVVIAVEISTWFILCSFTLPLFLTVVKRRQELVLLEGKADAHRAILAEYSVPFLDHIAAILTSATLVFYALYAMEVGEEEAGRQMQWTIPFVLYGIFRYLYVVYRYHDGGDPTAVVWRDRPLQINLGLWVAASILGLYTLP